MELAKVIKDFESLPEEAKREVADFIAFLKSRYTHHKKTDQFLKSKLTEESFVGLWKDREDLSDSSAWLRDVRKTEWKNDG